jgi:hypothetical protein
MVDKMITRDQAIEIMENLNERAHQDAWDEWVEADRLEEEEEDYEAAEHQRECASEIQMDYFCDHFADLDKDTRRSIARFALTDEDFRENYWEPWCGLDPELEAEEE